MVRARNNIITGAVYATLPEPGALSVTDMFEPGIVRNIGYHLLHPTAVP